jgi:hypothetical protein
MRILLRRPSPLFVSLATLLFIAGLASSAVAGSVSLAWDANTETNLGGYIVVYGTSPGSYSASIDVGNRTSFAVPNLQDGQRYYFAVRAYNTSGQTSVPSNEVSATASSPPPSTDADGDGLPTTWEVQFGLNPNSASGDHGATGDPDRDSVHNLDEYRASTHPRGVHRRYFAEGAQGAFFRTRIALANPGSSRAAIVLIFDDESGARRTHFVELGTRRRATVDASALAGLDGRVFSTRVESDVPVATDRLMTWDGRAYGGHLETGVERPALVWYLTEGTTYKGIFSLFYLVQNPNDVAANVTVTFLLGWGAPEVRTYSIPARSRRTIWVNDQGGALTSNEISAVVASTNNQPIIVERALYLDSNGLQASAGSVSAGVTALSTRWVFAEGATGRYYDYYLLLSNPNTAPATVQAQYMLPDGRRLTRQYTIGAQRRLTILVDQEDRALRSTSVSVVLESVNGMAFTAERSMWWPGDGWHESHSSVGAVRTSTRWALAEGETGGPWHCSTYVLVANTSASAGRVRVTLLFDDGTTAVRELDVPATSRTNLAIGATFPQSEGRRFGALVESLGATPAQLVVERSIYWDSGRVKLAGGANALAMPLTP